MTEPESCHFHDPDLGPCIKVEHDDSSPHICSRIKLTGLPALEHLPADSWTNLFQRDTKIALKIEGKPRRIDDIETFEIEAPKPETYYLTECLDGFITKNTCLAWCQSRNAPLGSILTARYRCDCKGPLRKLTKQQRRLLRQWIAAHNQYQRAGALTFDAEANGLLDRWHNRENQVDDRLEIDPIDYLETTDDHGTDHDGQAVTWTRWVTRTKDEA